MLLSPRTGRRLANSALIIAITTVITLPMASFAEDTPQAREAAAKAFLKVQPVEQLYQDTINELSFQVQEEKRPEFLQTMSTAVDLPKLNQLAVTSLAKNFTADELNYMTQFYGSEKGKAIYNKFPNYLSDVGQGLKDVITLPGEEAAPAATSAPAAPPSSSNTKPAATKTNSKK